MIGRLASWWSAGAPERRHESGREKKEIHIRGSLTSIAWSWCQASLSWLLGRKSRWCRWSSVRASEFPNREIPRELFPWICSRNMSALRTHFGLWPKIDTITLIHYYIERVLVVCWRVVMVSVHSSRMSTGGFTPTGGLASRKGMKIRRCHHETACVGLVGGWPG